MLGVKYEVYSRDVISDEVRVSPFRREVQHRSLQVIQNLDLETSLEQWHEKEFKLFHMELNQSGLEK